MREAVEEKIGDRRWEMGEEQATAPRLRSLNPTPFLNRAACKSFLLAYAAQTRAHKYARVSGETVQAINEATRRYMIELVRKLPSKGRTI